MWGYMGNGYGWGGMAFGMVSMLLFWALLIAAVVVLVRHAWGSDRSPEGRQEKTALDILKERYARGEIEREEFEQPSTVSYVAKLIKKDGCEFCTRCGAIGACG